MSEKKPTAILASLATLLPELQAVYKDIHAHPELSMHETRTAQIAADHLKAIGFEVTTGVGKTGVDHCKLAVISIMAAVISVSPTLFLLDNSHPP